jgi:hypothetical protein
LGPNKENPENGLLLTAFPRRSLRQTIPAGLLALPIFNSSSHPAFGGAVIFAIEDIFLLDAGSESQLRGSFRFRPLESGLTEFPFHGAFGATPESSCERTNTDGNLHKFSAIIKIGH